MGTHVKPAARLPQARKRSRPSQFIAKSALMGTTALVMLAPDLAWAQNCAGAETRVWDGSLSNDWFSTTGSSADPSNFSSGTGTVNVPPPSAGIGVCIQDVDGVVMISDKNKIATAGAVRIKGETLKISGGGRAIFSSLRVQDMGSAVLEGANSLLIVSGQTDIGQFGSNFLDVSNAAHAELGVVILGSEIGLGTFNISGKSGGIATSAKTSSLYVGRQSKGFLNVSAGALLQSVEGHISSFIDSDDGTATIDGKAADGTASRWDVDDFLAIGRGGVGTLVVSNGAKVAVKSSSGKTRVGGDSDIGGQQKGDGTIIVKGPGSAWDNAELFLGDNGTGDLTVSAGGSVSSSSAILGTLAGSTGKAALSGTGSKWTSGALVIGDRGNGTLALSNGAKVVSGASALGRQAGGTGAASISGADSKWTAASLDIGGSGEGMLTLNVGGTLATAQIHIAKNPGSSGQLIIGAAAGLPAAPGKIESGASVNFGAGTGSLDLRHTGTAFDLAAPISGVGKINQMAGTTALTGNNTGFGGTVDVSGGTLLVNSQLGNASSSVHVLSGGTLGGKGKINGAVDLDGKLLGVAGNTLVVGSLDMGSTAVVDAIFGSTGAAPLLTSLGNLTLDGTLNVKTSGSFSKGGVYKLMTYAGTLTGDDTSLVIGTIPSGLNASDFSIQTGVAGKVNLLYGLDAGELLFWDGDNHAGDGAVTGGDGTWSTTSTNWTDAQGSINGAMSPQPGFAVFDGDAGTVTVSTAGGFIPTVTGMQFMVDGYTLAGGGIGLPQANSNINVGDGSDASAAFTATIASILLGNGGINKTGLGTLVLSGNNVYSGSTIVTGGTLAITGKTGGANGTIIGEVASPARAVVDGAAASWSVDALTVGGFPGDGSLEVKNGGTLTSTAASVGLNGIGMITVDGALSSWTNSSTLQVGRSDVDGMTGTGTLNITGDGFVHNLGATDIGSTAGSDGEVVISGADSGLISDGILRVGSFGSGEVEIADGAGLAAKADLIIGDKDGSVGTIDVHGGGIGSIGIATLGNFEGATGTVTFDDGSWDAADIRVGGSGVGTLNIGNGAVVSGLTTIGQGATGDGTVSVTGADSEIDGTGLVVGLAGRGTLTIEQGAVGFVDALTVGNDSGSLGFVTLATGGTLTVGGGAGTVNIGINDGSVGVLAIGGGAEINGSVGAPVTPGVLNATSVKFSGGSGAVLFNHDSADYTFNAALSGNGGLVQHAGTTHLSADSSDFTGLVGVNGGTLLVDGVLGGIGVQVDNGALGGKGAILGNVLVTDGGTLVGMQGQTLTMDSLVLSAGSSIDATFTGPNGGALFAVGTDLTLDGTLNIKSGNALFGPGTYALFTYGGTLTGDDSSIAIGSTPFGTVAGDYAIQTEVAGQVNLVNSAAASLSFWDGSNTTANGAVDGGTGTWTVTGTNWTDSEGAQNGAMKPQPGFAWFGGPAGVTSVVTVDDEGVAGAIGVKGMQFASDGYTVTGDSITLNETTAGSGFATVRVGNADVSSEGWKAVIASNLVGSAGLDKDDYGTLILAGTNSYAGGTKITTGDLQIGNGGTTGSVTGAIDVAAGAGLIFNRSDNSSHAGVITGAGVLTQAGTGTTSLTGDSGGFAGDIVATAGTLAIEGGGKLGGNFLTIAGASGTSAAARVDGAGSAFVVDTDLVVGIAGTGKFDVTGGATATDGRGIIAQGAGSTGTASVSGAGSLWTNSVGLGVGGSGTGALTVSSGGKVVSAVATVGTSADGVGTLTLKDAGSSLDVAGYLDVGSLGKGTLTVSNGAALTSVTGYIGRGTSGVGAAAVDGAGSAWISTDALVIGDKGKGVLAVTGGGKIQSNGATLGNVAGSSGAVSIDGAGSEMTTQSLSVGKAGTGAVSVKNGGKLFSTTSYVAESAGSTGSVIVDGAGSSWTSFGATIGGAGNATLEVTNGGVVLNGNNGVGVIGLEASGTGVLNVTGAGSSYGGAGNIIAGYYGKADVTLGAGGKLTTGGVLTLAQEAGSAATLNIGAAEGAAAAAAGTVDAPTVQFGAGTAKLVFNHTSTTPYVFGAKLTGAGAFHHVAGSTSLTGDSGGFTGTTNVSGGLLAIDGTLGGQVNVATGGTLGGGGTAGMVDVAAGGTLLGVQGEKLKLAQLTLHDGANVDVVLSGPGAAAMFDVAGSLKLDGVLNVSGAFGPGLYALMTAASIDDQGLAIGDVPLGGNAADFQVQVLNDAGMAVKQVNLVSAADLSLLFWDGAGPANDGVIQGGSGTWGVGGTNWTNAAGKNNGPMNPQPGFAIFDGTGGTVTVDGQVGVLGMQFAKDGYTVTGGAIELTEDASIVRVGAGSTGAGWKATIASQLTGAGGLNKTDPGTLILTGANDYAGNTLVSEGTLQVSGGGKITGGGNATIAGTSGAAASMKIDGAGSGWSGGSMLVGTTAGAGTLAITGGATVNATAGVVGSGAGSNGVATIDGAGSAFTSLGVFYVGNGGAGALTLANGGKLTAGGLNLGEGGNGVLNIGGAKGAAAAAVAGTLAGDVTFGVGGTGEVNFNHTAAATAYAFDSKLTGAGTINNVAGNTSLTADSSGFTGVANVLGGRLAVNGKLGGAVNVKQGGTLGGNGTIGSLSVASGGIVAPGNSIGTLTVTGNASFASGSTYAVELTGGTPTSDLIKVGGAATIADGAKLTVTKVGDAPYQVGAHYTVLTAAGGVTGNFLLDNPTQFIGLKLGKDANNVYLDLIKAKAFADAGITFNQKATGAALDLLPFEGALVSALASMQTDAQVQGALDQLSGEAHASARTILVEDSRFVRDAALGRLRSAFDGVAAGDLQTMAYGEDGTLHAVEANPEGIAWWSQGFGSWGSFSGDGNAAGLTRDTSGFLTGFDMGAGDQVRAGLTGGYSHTGSAIDGRASSIKSENYHFGLYAGAQLGRLSLRGGLAYSWHDVDVDRSVAFTGFSDKLSTDYHGNTSQAFIEAGYRIETGAFSLEPYASIAHASVTTDAAQEKGGAAALKLADATTDITWTTLGLRTAQHFDLGNVQMSTRASLGWRRALEDVTPPQGQSLAGSPAFAVAGLPAGRDSLSIEAGLDARVSDRFSLGVSYIGQHSARAQDHGVKGTMRLAF